MNFEWVYECKNLDELKQIEAENISMLEMAGCEFNIEHIEKDGNYILKIYAEVRERTDIDGDINDCIDGEGLRQ
jgi:hypothetical protein